MLNKKIFYATNPARIADALWKLVCDSGVALADMLIFLPSRRAVRVVEKMFVDKIGHSVILPRLVALGEGTDDVYIDDDIDMSGIVLTNMERVIAVAHLLRATGDACGIVSMESALIIAHDLVRMTDYLENEGVDISKINWDKYVDERFASHFQNKAKVLNIISDFLPKYADGRLTQTAVRNAGIRAWISKLNQYQLVVVCSSTASVPATADLMAEIAKIPHGRIILPGKIWGRECDLELDTNPYNSEYKFLKRIGCEVQDVLPIDVGKSAIDFMNVAFGNDCAVRGNPQDISGCHLVVCGRESIEAEVAAEIAVRSVAEHKSVLIITPDAAGNQRLESALLARNIVADFSGGRSGTMTLAGRAILNQFDRWIESKSPKFDELYVKSGYSLMNTIVTMVEEEGAVFTPEFDVEDKTSLPIWNAISELSDCVTRMGLRLNVADARSLLADAIGGCTVRSVMNDTANVVVLGTIESRMQTADVVILSGLNEGMFPARGYDNNWLPKCVAKDIGLPSPDRKVSLMALDFMNLSCGAEVYWLRCTVSGGAEQTESRFLSRVAVAGGKYDADSGREIVPYDTSVGDAVIDTVLKVDKVPVNPLDYSAPTPPADWSDVYVTELEYLIHNPYSFYARHILGLKPKNDYWEFPGAAEFGNLVHDTIERCATDNNMTPQALVYALDRGAKKKLGDNNIIFDFWHHRFVGFADLVVGEINAHPDIQFEVGGKVDVFLDAEKQSKRTVRARADGVWHGGVLDIKTGKIPNDKQFKNGTMPQLPLEALMLIRGGFGRAIGSVQNPEMKFLHLQRKNPVVIDVERIMPLGKSKNEEAEKLDIIQVAYEKIAGLFRTYSAGKAPYEYRQTPDDDMKSHLYDDLARIDD